MSVQNGERLATKQDLADMYQGILPYLGGMPEIVANKFSKGDLYSTDEKMIGQWIDGKPLYQKTVTGNVVLTTWLDIGVTEDITVVGIKGTVINVTDNGTLPINYANTGSYTLSVVANTNEDKGKFIFLGSSNYANNHSFRLTFQYTKTTDTAISIGEATDYSTEEKIVGTWIDGKPLYQKVVIINNPYTNWDTTNSYGVSNIEYLVDVQSRMEYADGSFWFSTFYNDSTNYCQTLFDTSNFRLKANLNIKSVVLTLQYTKTTD